MLWNAEKAWRGATAPSLIREGSRDLSYQVCYSKDKEVDRGQNKEGSQKVEACRRRKNKIDRVSLITPGWSIGKEYYPFSGC